MEKCNPEQKIHVFIDEATTCRCGAEEQKGPQIVMSPRLQRDSSVGCLEPERTYEAVRAAGPPSIAEQLASLVTEQAPPQVNSHPAVWPLVVADMQARDAEGRRKYGVPLQPHNGRDNLVDAYQEALDLVVYLRTAIYERDGR